jgi:hypothetical protein
MTSQKSRLEVGDVVKILSDPDLGVYGTILDFSNDHLRHSMAFVEFLQKRGSRVGSYYHTVFLEKLSPSEAKTIKIILR